MTDNDRLREEIAHLKTEVEMGDGQIAHLTVQLPDDQVNAIHALIAREVRLGKIEEGSYMWINFGSNEDGIEFNKHFSELKESPNE